MKRINVMCAMRDLRAVEGLRRQVDDRYLFCEVKNGVTALRRAAEERPDVLIVDAVLPYLDGIGLIEQMREMFGLRMPEVIGGSVLSFSDEAFRRHGVKRLAVVPWNPAQLSRQLSEIAEQMDTTVNWERAQRGYEQAGELLQKMGMNDKLRGFDYLAWSAALASENVDRLYAVGEKLYEPVARRFETTPQCVERLIRHAVERTADTVGEHGIYAFFGNTIDPMRGKPTNAQIIAMLAERVKISENDGIYKKNEINARIMTGNDLPGCQ